MESLYGWVQNIAVYFVLITVFLGIIPGNQYKKYVKFFTGLLFIVMVITPLGGFARIPEKLNEALEFQNYESEVAEMNRMIAHAEDFQKEEMLREYEVSLETEIVQKAEEKGLYVKDISIECVTEGEDYGTIKNISFKSGQSGANDESVQVSAIDHVEIDVENAPNNEETKELKQFKKELSQYYHISDSHINISIER